MSDFILKRWEVTVSSYGSSIRLAPTRGKAMADTWRCDAFSHLSFGEFLRIARCRRTATPPPPFGDPITVCGKVAFFVDRNSQYVQFAWPGGEFTLNSHPFDVEPESYRPSHYRVQQKADQSS
jgi:hypothetical protein